MVTQHHSQWLQKIHLGVYYCDLGHTADLIFANVEQFRAHFLTEHREAHDDDRRMKAYIRRNRKPGEREEHVCPLCERRIDDHVEPPSHYGLLAHICHHLRYLAMFSLPYIASDAASNATSDADSTQAIIDDEGVDENSLDGSLDSFHKGEQDYYFQEREESAESQEPPTDIATANTLREQLESKMARFVGIEDLVLRHFQTTLDAPRAQQADHVTETKVVGSEAGSSSESRDMEQEVTLASDCELSTTLRSDIPTGTSDIKTTSEYPETDDPADGKDLSIQIGASRPGDAQRHQLLATPEQRTTLNEGT
jgi:hypothetical protein